MTIDNQDQAQNPFDPSATQIKPKRRGRPSEPVNAPELTPSQDIQSQPTRIEKSTMPLGGPTRRLPPQSQHAVRPASPGNAAQQQSASARQQPQPIIFAEVEVDTVVTERQLTGPSRPIRFRKTRRWLRSRPGRIVVPVITLLIGLVIGLSSLLWYGLSGEGPAVLVPPVSTGSILVEVNKDFLTQLVRNNIATSAASLPGHLKNVNLTLKSGAEMIITGDDVYSILDLQLSRQLTIDIQPYVQSCMVQTRITHADLGGIPITTFVQAFSGNINKQFALKPTGLPAGFSYCTSGVRTEAGGMFITYQAIALSK
jgi:hypothetical protein